MSSSTPLGAGALSGVSSSSSSLTASTSTSSTTSLETSATTRITSASITSVTSVVTQTVGLSPTAVPSVSQNVPTGSSNGSVVPVVSVTPIASSGVPTGAAAGIGVGCAVVGALIALMLSNVFFKKRETRYSSRRSNQKQKSNSGYMSDKEPAAIITQRETIDSELDRLLPQEADDSTVRKKTSTLFDQLELHVENYYSDVKVPITPTMESELSRFSSPHLSEPLVAFLNSTSRPRQLIKHSLAFHVINLTSVAGEGTRSLVAPDIVETVRTVNKCKPTPDYGLAFSRWRMLTAYLRPDLLSETRINNGQPDRALAEAVRSFTHVFAPWSKPEVPDAEKIKNLSDIMEEAIKFAVWLFSQPSSFKYDWKPAVDVRDRAIRSVVTVPAVLKVTENRGQALVRPVVIVDASRTRV